MCSSGREADPRLGTSICYPSLPANEPHLCDFRGVAPQREPRQPARLVQRRRERHQAARQVGVQGGAAVFVTFHALLRQPCL